MLFAKPRDPVLGLVIILDGPQPVKILVDRAALRVPINLGFAAFDVTVEGHQIAIFSEAGTIDRGRAYRDVFAAVLAAMVDRPTTKLDINDREFAAPQVIFADERTGRFVIEIGGA